eukprot:GHUV01047788.1.p2 GENE.GHUV01047788.1~~GHUV01047788.1.p2  ORF type:complete len:103 (+),score=22.90 GHUV01047788.1:91-399(+)
MPRGFTACLPVCLPVCMLVFCVQFLMVKELFMLARVAQKDLEIPGFRAQQWYFFFVATFYLYLRWACKQEQQRFEAWQQCSTMTASPLCAVAVWGNLAVLRS